AWGGALARGPTGRAPCGPLRLALRVPGGRPPRGGSHQRRDAVACRTSPLVDLGRRHCACRGEGACSCLEGLAWAGRAVWWRRAPMPPVGRCAPLLVERSFTLGCVPHHWVATSSTPPAGCCGVFLPPGRRAI